MLQLIAAAWPGAAHALRVGLSRGPTGSAFSHFHQKAYVFQGVADTTLLIGSANCSGNSYFNCYEMSVEVQVQNSHSVATQFVEAAEKLWTSSKHDVAVLHGEFSAALNGLVSGASVANPQTWD